MSHQATLFQIEVPQVEDWVMTPDGQGQVYQAVKPIKKEKPLRYEWESPYKYRGYWDNSFYGTFQNDDGTYPTEILVQVRIKWHSYKWFYISELSAYDGERKYKE